MPEPVEAPQVVRKKEQSQSVLSMVEIKHVIIGLIALLSIILLFSLVIIIKRFRARSEFDNFGEEDYEDDD